MLLRASQLWSLHNASKMGVRKNCDQQQANAPWPATSIPKTFPSWVMGLRQDLSLPCTCSDTHQLLVIQFQLALSLVSLHKHAEHVPGHLSILSMSIQSTVLQLGFAFRNLATHEIFDSRTRSAQSVEPPETGRIQCQGVFGTRSSRYLGMGNFHTHFGTRTARALSSETVRTA